MTADGVLPDQISRNSEAQSWLAFVDLAPGLDVATWLRGVATPAVAALTATGVAVCTTAVGATLFDKAGRPEQRPIGLATPLPAQVPPDSHDLVFYVFTTSDAAVATFLRAINPGVAVMTIERGYQRSDKREVFGQPDGLRNIAPGDRAAVAFTGQNQPDEPSWSRGGSYLAYVKIEQDVAAWSALTPADQEQIIGRRADGSRLDQPAGAVPVSHGVDEPPFADATTPPVCAHIRKAGPRGPEQDTVRIFRRGTPYIDSDGGKLVEGLQFVSFQASIDEFLTVLQRWMLNPGFPTAGAGMDSLFDPARGLTTIRKGGVYFAVPRDHRCLGAGIFDADSRAKSGIVIHLVVLDTTGNPDPTASLEDAQFQITGDPASPAPVTLVTDAAGRAVSPPLPTGVALTVQQLSTPAGSDPVPGPNPQPVTLEHCDKTSVTFTNTRTSANPGGYGAA